MKIRKIKRLLCGNPILATVSIWRVGDLGHSFGCWRLFWSARVGNILLEQRFIKEKLERISKMAETRFDGRVALVTGAGGGLGRAYALLLASRGAKVVVNDLGGSKSGEGVSSRAADIVVQEILSGGGVAAPNYDSVEEGEKLIQTAIDKFGRIDIVINNAGILRDKSLLKMADTDWDLVHRVHLRAAYKVTKAAWPHMKDNKYGRIIMTSSIAGLLGNYGQANYSAAKMGLVGLSNTLALEGAKFNIHSNVIVPMAASRLTQDVLPPDVFESLGPEFIAPVVAWLCNEECQDTGMILEAAGGWAGRYRWSRSYGKVLTNPETRKVSIEDVRDGWSEVVDMELSSYPESTQQSTMDTLSMIEKSMPKKVSETASTSPLDAVGFTSEPKSYSYSFKEVILYALGIGASTAQPDNLKFLYENHEDFFALPTFGVIPALSGLESLITGQIPGLDFDLSMVLHGEQFIEIFRPYATSGTLSQTFEIKDVLDKGSGMVLILDAESRDQHDQLVCRNQCTIFVRGKGGFNGPRQSEHSVPVKSSPSRQPDRTLSFKTSVDQAALYRLSADLNPLHIDPNFSAIGGFSKPILHGLCTYGIAARHVMEAFCANDPSLVRSVKARFSKPVYPGETVCTDMWLEDDIVLFKCRVLESGEECLSGGWVKLNKPKQKL